jgi:hypothetical protein
MTTTLCNRAVETGGYQCAKSASADWDGPLAVWPFSRRRPTRCFCSRRFQPFGTNLSLSYFGVVAICLPPMLTLLLSCCISLPPASARPQRAVEAKPAINSRFLMAHYMPWFQARPTGKQWGWHWTMSHYQPDHVTHGRREAASHYYPLIGLYDSNDPDALQCHVLLMKLAGIDGVIIDWYGTDDYLDYGAIHRSTQHLIQVVRTAGLRFAICHEDQSVPRLIAGHRLPQAEAIAYGQRLLQWMQEHWFSSPTYLRLEDRPVLLVFGPQFYQDQDWDRIFEGLPRRAQFFTLQDRRGSAVGAFGWPAPAGGTEQSFQELDRYYLRAKEWPLSLPAAYPRFHDIYHEAGVGKSFGFIDDRSGKTYEDTLERALKSKAPVTQLVTWNDWGEGTILEPSIEFGYRDLETTQRLRRNYLEPAFPYTARDLRLPVQWYLLRKKYKDHPAIQPRLRAVFRLLLAGKLDRARALLRATPVQGSGLRGRARPRLPGLRVRARASLPSAGRLEPRRRAAPPRG